MPIPVPIPGGPLVITNDVTSRAEALVAAITQVLQSGTMGGALTTPATIISAGVNPAIDPGTGLPAISSVTAASAQDQLFFRQLAVAMARTLPTWVASDLKFNEVPTGTVNGVNKVFTTANKFLAGTTALYYARARLLLGTDYTENVGHTGFTIAAGFTAPAGGIPFSIDYVRDGT